MTDTTSQVWKGSVESRPISKGGEGILGSALVLLSAIFTRDSRGSTQLADEAIDLLSDSGADADKRDWAERYLCGMEQVDFGTYLARRVEPNDNARKWHFVCCRPGGLVTRR